MRRRAPAGPSIALAWPGKERAIAAAAAPARGRLVTAPGLGVRPRTAPHAVVEGDALEALKLLLPDHRGAARAIYVDPPFNSGKELAYGDGARDPARRAAWLDGMWPRLVLARELLAEDGVLFLSIDDHEVHTVRLLLDEIFGPGAFLGQLVWRSRRSADARARSGLSVDHEYVICYRRGAGARLRGGTRDLAKFANPDGDPRGPWRSADLTGLATRDRRPNLHYDLVDPTTGAAYPCPPRGWRFAPATMSRKIAEGRVLWPAAPGGRPRHKLFLAEAARRPATLSSVILDVATADGTRELDELLGPGLFSFPKPVELVGRLIDQVCGPEDLVVDFFAGSGTTGHAVLERNLRDGLRRRFLLVQAPEPVAAGSAAARAGFSTLADLCRERLRRAIARLEAAAPPEARDGLGFRAVRVEP
jgi:adenine-specific DNA-methyltransferase